MVFDQNTAGTYTGTVSGTGSLTLSGANTYSGGTFRLADYNQTVGALAGSGGAVTLGAGGGW